MFKILVAICVVTSFDGRPVNKCYVFQEENRYVNVNDCSKAAQIKESEIVLNYNDSENRSAIVVQAICIKESQV